MHGWRGWGGEERKRKKKKENIWATVLFLPRCKSGADPLMFAWLSALYDKALALEAKVCVAHQQFPQNTGSGNPTLIPEAHHSLSGASLQGKGDGAAQEELVSQGIQSTCVRMMKNHLRVFSSCFLAFSFSPHSLSCAVQSFDVTALQCRVGSRQTGLKELRVISGWKGV